MFAMRLACLTRSPTRFILPLSIRIRSGRRGIFVYQADISHIVIAKFNDFPTTMSGFVL